MRHCKHKSERSTEITTSLHCCCRRRRHHRHQHHLQQKLAHKSNKKWHLIFVWSFWTHSNTPMCVCIIRRSEYKLETQIKYNDVPCTRCELQQHSLNEHVLLLVVPFRKRITCHYLSINQCWHFDCIMLISVVTEMVSSVKKNDAQNWSVLRTSFLRLAQVL